MGEFLFETTDRFPARIRVPKQFVHREGEDFFLAEDAEVVTEFPPQGVEGTPERDSSCPDGRTQCAGGIMFCCGQRAIGNCQGAWSCKDS